MDEVKVFLLAGQYLQDGYICISKKYSMIGRPDIPDWHIELAKRMNCAPADFYMTDGSGLAAHWKDHYVRVYSTDKLEVPEAIYRKMKKRY